jgi:hypothetical protein
MPDVMPAPTAVDAAISTLEILRDERIHATPAKTWETLLALLGPLNEAMPGHPMPMKLEAWPGGRWFRDLGGNTGHFWGHVQVIKPPALLELCGPLFMSYPGVNHVQYRLAAEGAGTHLRLVHRAMGVIPADHKAGVVTGWEHQIGAIKRMSER